MEIPKDCGAKELFMEFLRFGDIDEVIIPPKRDVRGKGYGLVRFFDVKEVEFFATKLDNIFIGRRKLHVNTPKHKRRGVWVVVVDDSERVWLGRIEWIRVKLVVVVC